MNIPIDIWLEIAAPLAEVRDRYQKTLAKNDLRALMLSCSEDG